jgi:hypothetical protein
MMTVITGPFSPQRMVHAVEKVRQRLFRTAAALQAANVPYAIVGGNAVALWVSRVDESAVRNTQDVDVLVRREDFPAATAALEAAGFIHRHIAGIDIFLDGTDARPHDAVHIIFANEKMRPDEPLANPDVTESEESPGAPGYRVLSLEALVRIKLTAFRDKDRTHLRDLIHNGLLDDGWLTKLHPVLSERLGHLLNTPEG